MPSLAQDAPKPKRGGILQVELPIAVLDVQKILSDSSAVKNIREQVAEYSSTFENEVEKKRNEIRTANQELTRQRTILSPDAFAEKRRLFEEKVVGVQRLVQQRQRELDASRNKAMADVNKAYTEIVAQLAAERNLAVILRKVQTVFTIGNLDVTQEVLSRLNKQLPTVKIDKPGSKVAKPKK
ncbi:MAG: OmpH family outer membrane protein [Proteobacteria bacterium]|nr:OmpH family outer membrane protein [Pseudomonadota bacterium]